jgi:hypothetical protein
VEPSVLGGQVRGPGGETRPAVDVDGLGQTLVERALDHDLLADVAQGVGDRPGRNVAAEHVAHVLPRTTIPCHVREIPANGLCSCQLGALYLARHSRQPLPSLPDPRVGQTPTLPSSR